MKTLRIGLFGFGHVGRGFFEITQKLGKGRFSIEKICVKTPGKNRSLPPHYFTYEPDDILQNPEIDIVVEAIGGSEEAYPIAQKALANRKPLITANKKMVAENLPDLIEWQDIYHTPLRYEAAVCGAIPAIHTVDSYLRSQDIQSIRGIFNGSSNYILTQVFDNGRSYAEALEEAQELGFAEVDPRLDVGGFDALSKLVILLHQAYGLPVAPAEVPRFGIAQLAESDMAFAKANRLKIKPLAHLHKSARSIQGWVMPAFIAVDSPLYNIDQELNAVEIEATYSGKLLFAGKGAGSHPTGSAVYADLLNISQEIERSIQAHPAPSLRFDAQAEAVVYVRGENLDQLADLPIQTVLQTGSNYVVGKALLKPLQEATEEKAIFVCEAEALPIAQRTTPQLIYEAVC